MYWADPTTMTEFAPYDGIIAYDRYSSNNTSYGPISVYWSDSYNITEVKFEDQNGNTVATFNATDRLY